MTNKDILKILRQMAALMELHAENEFKTKAFYAALQVLERAEGPICAMQQPQLMDLGLKKGMAEKVAQLCASGTLPEREELLERTPEGLLQVMEVKGLGPKKVAALWRELGITSVDALEVACRSGQVASLKGFGAKTSENILTQLAFVRSQGGKLRFAEAEPHALQLRDYLMGQGLGPCELAGQLRRCCEVIEVLQLCVATADRQAFWQAMQQYEHVTYQPEQSGPFTWRGEGILPVEIYVCSPERFVSNLFLHTATGAHLGLKGKDGRSLYQIARHADFEREQAIYEAAGMPYFIPELREGLYEMELMAQPESLADIVQEQDLCGILHVHTVYSDGQHTLEEMAQGARDLGMQYLGITDHSQAAFYANGLTPERIAKQQAEIDALNERMAPFRILKGIECDILPDGSLDYTEEVLRTFDFVIASVHSNLQMDQQKATERLLKAIANPYTSMLGHPTGRLLLKREGYPIDHRAVIDACAQHGVSIEINANPLRLDLDWRWVRYAISKGVRISINPDAHSLQGYADTRYGCLVARKAALPKAMTVNATPLGQLSFRK